MKKDLEGREDVIRMVQSFYGLVQKDELIGPIFTDLAKVDWEHHLPKMYDFWESLLFRTYSYQGNPMQVHKDLHSRFPLEEAHFERWMQLFTHTVDSLFGGPMAELAKTGALSSATIIRIKISPSL